MHRFLPLAHFAARRQLLGRRPQRLRLVAILVLSLVYVSVHAGRAATMWGPSLVGSGAAMLSAAAWLNYAIVLVAAVSLFATPVTDDRESGTLPLLIAADVRPATYLLGKLFAVATAVGLMLVVQLPLLASPLFFGGVTRPQVWSAVGLCASAAGMWACVGLSVSVLVRSNRMATVVMAAMVLLVEGAGPIGGWLSGWPALPPSWSPIATSLWSLHPWSSATLLDELLVATSEASVRPMVLTHLIASVAALLVAFVAAPVLLPKTARLKATRVSGGRRLTRRWRADAIAAKEHRLVSGGGLGLLVRVVGYPAVAAAAAWWFVSGGGTRDAAAGFALTVVGAVAAVDGWRLSTSLLGREINDRTLATLTLTDSSPLELLWRKIAGLLAAALPFAATAVGLVLWRPTLLEDAGSRATAAAAAGAVLLLWTLSTLCSLSYPKLGWAVAAVMMVVLSAVALPLGAALAFILGAKTGDVSSAVLSAAYFAAAAAAACHLLTLARMPRAAADV